ncbi:MAG: MFS transporter, partial [Terriglobus roseus]|nr:MFS transporter [Terriglobus roseus]
MATPQPPVGEDEDKRLSSLVWKVASVAAIGSFMAQLDATLINVSLPNLAMQLHTDLGTIQWTMSGYLLALALVLPLNSWVVSRIRSRALYLWCFAAFTTSSVLCGAAWSAGSLIMFRVLQGISGGLLAPMAQLMIARVAGQQMTRVMGFVTVPILIAPLLGPVLAGLIVQFASWRWLFLINLPVGLLALALAASLLPDDREESQSRSLDLLGLGLISPGSVLFLYGADHSGETIGGCALTAGIVLLVLYAWTARHKGEAALVDLRLFGHKGFPTAVALMF